MIVHVFIGITIYKFPYISKIYSFIIPIIGLYFTLINKNKNNEILYVAAYIIGSEVLLRATKGTICYDFAKYSISFFMVLGIYFNGFSKKAYFYVLFLLLLLPSILISMDDFTIHNKNKIFFDIFGPICLGLSSIYCYKKRLQIQN